MVTKKKPQDRRPLAMKRPERTLSVCLDASLQAEWEQAERALVAARKVTTDRLTGNPEVARLAKVVTDLEAAMLEQVAVFRLRGVQRSEWARVIASHPPKPGNADDEAFGADRDAFFEEIIPPSIISVTQGGELVEFDVATEWDALADDMTDWQYSQFAEAVYVLNRGAVSVPFSQAASRVTRDSSAT